VSIAEPSRGQGIAGEFACAVRASTRSTEIGVPHAPSARHSATHSTSSYFALFAIET
jgi:hypothetical protein